MVVANLLSSFIPAYIDPGSGSIIFQAIVAGSMAVYLTVKVYWRRFRGLFRRQER